MPQKLSLGWTPIQHAHHVIPLRAAKFPATDTITLFTTTGNWKRSKVMRGDTHVIKMILSHLCLPLNELVKQLGSFSFLHLQKGMMTEITAVI